MCTHHSSSHKSAPNPMSKLCKCHMIHQPTHLSYSSSRYATASATPLMMRSMASHVPHYPQKARNPMSKILSASKNPLVCTSQLHIIWMCYCFGHATCDGDGDVVARMYHIILGLSFCCCSLMTSPNP
jgi:hypothetical protein